MERAAFSKWAREELNKNGLSNWGLRINSSLNPSFPYLGLCSYKDQCIIISSHHLQIHPDEEIYNTVRHEIAHALVGHGNGHNEIWSEKAKEVGCISVQPCSHLSFPPHVIDAIRSGADVEVTVEIETIHKPKYTVTRLQDKCPVCGKVAKTKNELLIENKDPFKPDEKFIYLECGHLLLKKIPKGTPFQTLITRDGAKPYTFQIEGMRFIEQALAINKGAAVFDEMGLGKTIQALGYLKFHPEAFPVLLVVKSATKFQWFKEELKWLGDDHLFQMIQTSNDWLIPGLKGYIISYDMMVPKTRTGKNGKQINQGFDIAKFAKIGIKTVILDECQQIKNPDSARTQEVRRLIKNSQVIALSGTPWKNRGSEFFTILNMLAPMKFPTHQGFLDRWVDYYMQGTRYKEGGIRNVKAFREYIKDIAIRREIKDVSVQMPDVTRNLLFCELAAIEQHEYDESVSEFVKWYNEKVIGGEEDDGMMGQNILAKMARMRHITGLAKIPATVEFAEEFIEETERKLCIFVHHQDVGQLMAEKLRDKLPDTPVFSLTSDLNPQRRFELQEEFNQTKQCVMVASTLASGEGLNLQTCSDAILHERQWNPANEDQAAPGRFRRIGAAALELGINITVTCTTASGTIDEQLASIVERKRKDYHTTMNTGEIPVWNQTSLAKELAEAIVKDHNKKKRIDGFTKFGS